jgi:hypothetical protein
MEILDPSEALPLRGRGAAGKYPWDTWLQDKQTVRIFQGEDFKVNVVTMRQMIYQKAAALGGKVSTAVGKDLSGRACIDLTFHAAEDLELEMSQDFDNLFDKGERNPLREPLGP